MLRLKTQGNYLKIRYPCRQNSFKLLMQLCACLYSSTAIEQCAFLLKQKFLVFKQRCGGTYSPVSFMQQVVQFAMHNFRWEIVILQKMDLQAHILWIHRMKAYQKSANWQWNAHYVYDKHVFLWHMFLYCWKRDRRICLALAPHYFFHNVSWQWCIMVLLLCWRYYDIQRYYRYNFFH